MLGDDKRRTRMVPFPNDSKQRRIEISPKFRGTGVGQTAIDRTIDIFGPVCGLVACKPWPLQYTPAFARDRKALKRLKAPGVGQDDAVKKLRVYWSRLGFWPLGETGIYLLGMTQRGSVVAPAQRETLAVSAPGAVGRRVCWNAALSPTSDVQSIRYPRFPRRAHLLYIRTGCFTQIRTPACHSGGRGASPVAPAKF
jgi:hypothetical protein